MLSLPYDSCPGGCCNPSRALFITLKPGAFLLCLIPQSLVALVSRGSTRSGLVCAEFAPLSRVGELWF